jgi:hypothetical protein
MSSGQPASAVKEFQMEYWFLAHEEELAKQFEHDGPGLSWDEFLLAEYVGWLSTSDEIERHLRGWEARTESLMKSSQDQGAPARKAA